MVRQTQYFSCKYERDSDICYRPKVRPLYSITAVVAGFFYTLLSLKSSFITNNFKYTLRFSPDRQGRPKLIDDNRAHLTGMVTDFYLAKDCQLCSIT